MPSPLGDKMRALRKEKKLSLEQLAELTDSSKSYIWELENKDVPRPSAEKIGRIAAALEVTPDPVGHFKIPHLWSPKLPQAGP